MSDQSVGHGLDVLYDPDDLARQILTLLNDLELSKRLAQSASERVLSKFTWHESQKRLGKVYEKLLQGFGGFAAEVD